MVGETSPAQEREQTFQRTVRTSSDPLFTNQGDTWGLPQEPPVTAATQVPLFPGSHLQEDTFTFIPQFSLGQNRRLGESRKICQVGEAHRSSQNKDTFSDSH